MGRVFAWEEITDHYVPQLESFDILCCLLETKLSNSPAIKGALVCGSYVRGDYNIRSDIDCVAVYDWQKRADAMKVFQRLEIESSKKNIPLEMIPLDDKLAATPNHHFNSTFIDHLRLSVERGGIIKRNPVELIHPNPLSYWEDTRLYLIHKIRKLEKGSAAFPVLRFERPYVFLQKALEFPIYAARKMIQCADRKFKSGDSKKEVLDIYASLNIKAASSLLQEIVALDEHYSQCVERQLIQKDRELYFEVLREIVAVIPKVLNFARSNLDHLSKQEVRR
ncbi:MAG: hypothetical protein FJZ04_00590 [Candidatus Moranbacteria bacterium]|nr:hypothetical protein [Candidatus Moranbacteria bacterium]